MPMSATVNLLLLLSALLSALTGVQAGARPAQAAVAVSQAVAPRKLVRAVPATVARPAAALPALATLAAAPLWHRAILPIAALSSRRE